MQHSFNVDVAKKYGILEAVIMNNMSFWIEKNKANGQNFHDGHYWTYNSTVAFSKLFPYASKRQIEKALMNLRENDIIITGNYNTSAYDRTLWYAITEKGESILPNGEMETTENVNGNNQSVTPIPDSKHKLKQHIKNTDSKSTAYDEYKSIYNSTCSNLPKVIKLTDKRKRSIKTFEKELTLDQWKEVCQKAQKSDFLTGKNDNGWKADFDFLIKPDKALKTLEGAYDGQGKHSAVPYDDDTGGDDLFD